MASKKKLIISLSAVCLVAIIAVVAVVAVLAAGTQAVQTSVTITYTASDVSATVSANQYLIARTTNVGDAAQAFTSADGSSVSFSAINASTTGTLIQPANADLTSEKNAVVFEFIFENDSASVPMLVTLEEIDTENLNQTFDLFYKTGSTTRVVFAQEGNTVVDINTSTFAGFRVEPETTAYAYIKVQIDDANKSNNNEEAELSIKWNLTATTRQEAGEE